MAELLMIQPIFSPCFWGQFCSP